MVIDFDPILEEWAENTLLSYGIMLIILSVVKFIFHLSTLTVNAYFRDTLVQSTSIPESIIVCRHSIDALTVLFSAIFATLGAVMKKTSYITLTIYILIAPFTSSIQIWTCMQWMLLDEKHSIYPLIETSLDLPIGIIQLLGISVTIPLKYREFKIIKDLYL